MGEVFCGNVFGHCCLCALLPLLNRPAGEEHRRGRIIGESSIEPQWDSLNLDDFQAIQTSAAYESTKRLTDILALASSLPGDAGLTWTRTTGHNESDAEQSWHNTARHLPGPPGRCLFDYLPAQCVPVHRATAWCLPGTLAGLALASRYYVQGCRCAGVDSPPGAERARCKPRRARRVGFKYDGGPVSLV